MPTRLAVISDLHYAARPNSNDGVDAPPEHHEGGYVHHKEIAATMKIAIITYRIMYFTFD